ncbi:MAG: S-layer homology domain-containing protein [Candidatus Ornithomonoglobus sp.]
MIKKIFAVILAVGMMLSSLCAFAYTDLDNTKQNTAADLVTGLGIMAAKDDSTFGSTEIVTRGEFALYVAKLMKYNVVLGSGKSTFDDVDISTEQGAAIELLVGIGAVAAVNEFNPNEPITYNAAIKILLTTLGYGVAAENNGGYPNGYIKTATENDLNNNLSNVNANALTKKDVATLLYNALFVYPMELNNRDYTKSSETVLEKIYDAYEVTGVVTGYGDMSLANRSMADTQVSIGSTVYDCITPSIKNYVGMKVKAYYTNVKGDGEKLVAFTEQSNQNTVTTFDIDDFDEVTSNGIKYYINGSTTSKTVRVASNATVLYNDRYTTTNSLADINALLSKVYEGNVTLIANDGTGTANVVLINSYKHLLVERVDKKNHRLYLKNGKCGDLTADMIEADPDDIDVEVYIGDTEVTFDDIEVNDALTMKENRDGKIFYISRNVVTGTIGTISDEEVRIDGETYDLSKYVDKQYQSGDSGTFAITEDGKFLGIVAFGEGGSLRDYAYVLNSYADYGEELAILKLYTTSGEVVKLNCASNVSINKQKRNFREVEQQVKVGELITYSLNSKGEIATINRPYDASSKYISTDDEGNLKLYVNDTEFVKDWNKSSVRYIDGIMGMTFVTEDTVIFAMPRFDDGDESEYRRLKASELENRTYSDVTCYDIDRQGRAGALVIVEDVATSVSMSNNLFFISKINDAIAEDGEEVRRIKGFVKGQEVEIDMDDDTESVTYEDGWMNYSGNEDFDTGYRDLHIGDAIQYLIGNDGKVSAYRLVYNNKKTAFDKKGRYIENNSAKYFEDWSGTGAVTKSDFSDNLYIGYGDVQQRYSDYMLFLGLNQDDRNKYTSSSSPVAIMDYYRPFNLVENAYIYVYNVKKNELELGDIEDVQKDTVCFVRSKKMGEINEVMVYDN